MIFDSLWELWKARACSREPWSPEDALLGHDRRIFQRIAVQVPCRIENRLFGLEAQAETVNMSLGGLALKAPMSWPEGSRIRLQLEKPSLAVEGLIIFRRESSDEVALPFRYGVKFMRLHLKDLMRLRRFLRSHYSGPLAVH